VWRARSERFDAPGASRMCETDGFGERLLTSPLKKFGRERVCDDVINHTALD
jgi:hypothetical protein